jgi:membrane-associated protein
MFNPELLIAYGGLLLVFLSVYAQTGLFFCFFLPSGGLMFTTGVFIASGQMSHNIFTVCALLILASILGNITGYAFGKKAGASLYQAKESRFLKHRHLQKAENFYNKYGGLALAGGLFFPIIRTFAPIVAGMIKMNFRRFIFYTGIGSVAWILCFVLAGYLIGSMPFLKPYLTWIVVGIIVLVTIPVVFRIVKELRHTGK